MIVIVDYGLGNIKAFINIYQRLNIKVCVATTGADLYRASKIILPGVGAFDWAMTQLQRSGLREALDEVVLELKKPVLGICVGMQMMAHSSEEGVMPGLGWVDATVVKFDSRLMHGRINLPHMGWNDVVPQSTDTLFFGIEIPQYYFLHSYLLKPRSQELQLATSNYGGNFTSAIKFENIYGTQFHPEKSHNFGVTLLKNFAERA